MARTAQVGAVAAQPARRVSTFAALQNDNFRLYFIGQLISTSGTWMQTIAQGFLVFQITQSELWLGVVACASGLPMLIVAPFAGVMVEHLPRRRVLLVTQTVQMCLALILAALVFTNTVQIWHIVILALLLGTSNAFDAPARQTLISDLVGRDKLASGIALNSIIVNGSRVFGPTLAGILLATLGAGWCFLLNGISFLFVLIMLLILRVEHPDRPIVTTSPLAQLREGLRYVRGDAIILPLLLMVAAGGFFCWATLSLFPAFADVVLKSPKDGYAVISAANGFGAVIAGLLASWLSHHFGTGRLLSVVGPLTGISIALMSRMTTIEGAALMSASFGFCAIAFFVTINTSIQLAIPSAFRGRVLSLYTLLIIGLNPFGALLLGWIAERLGNPDALLIYATILGLILAAVPLKYPQVRKLKM